MQSLRPWLRRRVALAALLFVLIAAGLVATATGGALKPRYWYLVGGMALCCTSLVFTAFDRGRWPILAPLLGWSVVANCALVGLGHSGELPRIDGLTVVILWASLLSLFLMLGAAASRPATTNRSGTPAHRFSEDGASCGAAKD